MPGLDTLASVIHLWEVRPRERTQAGPRGERPWACHSPPPQALAQTPNIREQGAGPGDPPASVCGLSSDGPPRPWSPGTWPVQPGDGAEALGEASSGHRWGRTPKHGEGALCSNPVSNLMAGQQGVTEKHL